MAINISNQHAAQINNVEGTFINSGRAATSTLRSASEQLQLSPTQREELRALLDRTDSQLARQDQQAAAGSLEHVTQRLRSWGALSAAAMSALTQLAATLGPAGAVLHRVLNA
jgi:hypothetical protein